MPLQLPNLDDRRYADLVAEARRLIPAYDPAWTNHNPSDPGITLVELFAYLTELLLYRLDRVTADNQRKFLKLLNGPDWTPTPGADLNDDIRSTVQALRSRERAVTVADFEYLATDRFNDWLGAWQRAEQDGEPFEEWWQITRLDRNNAAHRPSAVPAVARATCVASRNLERGTEAERAAFAAAHVSLIVLPQDAGALQPPAVLKTALWGYLHDWRTLTTRHHVVGPRYAPIGAEIVLATVSGAVIESVRARLIEQLARFLDPLTGGPGGEGWPFGRDVYASEFYEQIEAVEGVDYVTDLLLTSDCAPTDIQCVAAPPVWHDEGDLVGLSLVAHQLPRFQIDPAALVLVPHSSFLRVRLTVTLTAESASDPAALKRQAKAAVRHFFHPHTRTLTSLPPNSAGLGTGLKPAVLDAALEAIPGVTAAALAWQADAADLYMEGGQVTGLYVGADEQVNCRVQVVVRNA
jgi:hypothetical protein